MHANALQRYQQNAAPKTEARIDVVLGLHDVAIKNLEQLLEARAAHAQTAIANASMLCQVAVFGLGTTVAVGEDKTSVDLRRLYAFVLGCLATADDAKLTSALRVLSTVREGFLGIRQDALERERCGELAPLVPLALDVAF